MHLFGKLGLYCEYVLNPFECVLAIKGRHRQESEVRSDTNGYNQRHTQKLITKEKLLASYLGLNVPKISNQSFVVAS